MNIFKKLHWVRLIIFTVLLAITTTTVVAATEDDKLKFTVNSPKAGEDIIKGTTKTITWSIAGTEDNLNTLIGQDRISRIYLMEKVYKKSGATTTKTTKLLTDIDLDGQIECNDAGTVCNLAQSYDWTVSSKLKSSSKYFIRIYLRSRPNFLSGLAKFFTLNNRYVYNDSGIFTLKNKGENLSTNQTPVVKTSCTSKLQFIKEGASLSNCCSGLKACRLADGITDICLSDCDAATVKNETSLLSSIVKVTGEVDSATTASYPSSLVPSSQTEGASLEHPNFQISKNADGTYKIHWFTGAFGPSNIVQTLIKDASGKVVFNSNDTRLPDSGFADFDMTLKGDQKYTIVLDKVFGSEKNIEYTFDSSLINGGAKITNNVLNKPFATSDSFLSFLNTAISADGKNFGIDFDLKDSYGYYATRPVNKIIITLSDGTKKTINVDDNFLSQQNKGIVLPLTATDKNIQIDLYDVKGNKIESKTLSVASNQNITLATDYKGATGWKSVYDPSIRLSSEGFYGNTNWKRYTINYDATGASKIVLMDTNGTIITSTPNSSMTLTDKQLVAGNGYYLAFYDGSGKLAHTEYISLDKKGNYDNASLTDPSIYFTTCGGGRYYIPFTVSGTKDFSFVGEGDAKNITFNSGDYIDVGLLKPGQKFALTYTDPIDNKVHTYTVTVTSEKLTNGSYRLAYAENTNAVVAALDCGKQGKTCLASSDCQKGSAIGQLNCSSGKVCCADVCTTPEVSCNGECVDQNSFNTDNSCGVCGVKCSTTEKCETKDGKYQCIATTISNDTCDGTCQGTDCDLKTQTAGTGTCNAKDKSHCCKNISVTAAPCTVDVTCMVGKCSGNQKCINGKLGACLKEYDNCDPSSGRFTQPGEATDTCFGANGSCQTSGCNFSTQSVGSGSCNSLEKPYCCKNTPTTPTKESPNCYSGAFLCGSVCCSLVSEDCVNNKCVAKENGCTSCGSANCGQCSSLVNGQRCVCSAEMKGSGHAWCEGQPDDTCKTKDNPCTAGTLSCGSDCCTASEDCVNNICVIKAGGCTRCGTAQCGDCSNGYLCSCTGVGPNGTGFAVCSGGTKKDPTCPGYCAAGTTLCGTDCCTTGYKCVSDKCVTNSTPVPSASILNLFSGLRQLITKWFK